jgi:hypothetical protein
VFRFIIEYSSLRSVFLYEGFLKDDIFWLVLKLGKALDKEWVAWAWFHGVWTWGAKVLEY